MSIEDNKALVSKFWQVFSEMRYDEMFDMLTDDAVWWVSGTTSLSGSHPKEVFRQMISGMGPLAPKGVQMNVLQVTAEDDRVAVEAVSHGELSNGKLYQNKYHLLLTVRDGKVSSVKEYMDTEHVTEVLG